ncbi:MAG: hypothetical protein V4565_00925 [Bacteroidota bacterium]
MKTLKNKFWALLLIGSVALLSCKKEDPMSPTASFNTATPQTPAATMNDWKITNYKVGEVVRTNIFADYMFKLNDDGTAEAYSDNGKEKGVWLINEKKANIQFTMDPLIQLTRDNWDVLMMSNSDIKLESKNTKDEVVSLTFHRSKKIQEIIPIMAMPDQINSIE